MSQDLSAKYIELKLEEVEQWTKDIVCSLLCANKQFGGAGLTIGKVAPLYHANFDGSSLSSIISYISVYDLKSALELARNDFRKDIDLSIISFIVLWLYSLLQSRVSSLSISPLKVQCFIGSLPNFIESIPYQNNRDNVLKVGKLLLNNLLTKEIRHSNLIINFAYYGFGKTRFGVDFLDLWSRYMENDIGEREKLVQEYGDASISRLASSELIYFDLSEKSNQYETVKYVIGSIPKNGSSYFVVLDEYTAFCAKNNSISLIDSMHRSWMELILPIQQLTNVIGVYVCGKGATLDMFGKSSLIDKQFRSPTLCSRIELQSLTRDNLNDICKVEIPQIKMNLEYTQRYIQF